MNPLWQWEHIQCHFSKPADFRYIPIEMKVYRYRFVHKSTVSTTETQDLLIKKRTIQQQNEDFESEDNDNSHQSDDSQPTSITARRQWYRSIPYIISFIDQRWTFDFDGREKCDYAKLGNDNRCENVEPKRADAGDPFVGAKKN